MTLWARLIALLAGVETRQWVAVGGSVLLHIVVLLGLRQAPPPPPEMVTFEIALQPPEAEPVQRPKQKRIKAVDKKPQKLAKAKKPKKPKRKTNESHTLEAAFKPESRTRKDAPAVSLPKEISTEASQVAAVTAKAQTRTPATQEATTATSQPASPTPDATATTLAAVTPSANAASTSNPAQTGDLSAPAPTTQAASTTSATTNATAGSAQSALALTAAQSLASGAASTGAEPSAGSATQGANAGPGAATFSGSVGAGGGLNLATGRGANPNSSSESAPMPGGEPQGVRLTASGTLSSLAEFPQSKGGLAAGQLALAASAASPADGQGHGQSSASIVAGGASASPLTGTAAGAGKGGQGAEVNHVGVAGVPTASGQSGSRLAGAGNVAKGLGDLPEGGNGNDSGYGSVRAAGKASRAPSASALRSQSLVPGEPGSGPQWAIVMAPVQVGVPVVYGPNRGSGRVPGPARAGQVPGVAKVAHASAGAQGGADETTGSNQSGRAQLAQAGNGRLRSAQSASAQEAAPGAGARGVAPRAGQALMGGNAPAANANAMSRIRPAEQKIMPKEDSRVETLDVLAPSNYCPLPIHTQPNNRVPQRQAEKSDSLPSYSSDNPPFVYPIMANIQGTQGKLVVRVQVLANGLPGAMIFKQSSGNAVLDRDARETLARWRFTPARKGGQAVDSWVDVPVIYRLSVDR